MSVDIIKVRTISGKLTISEDGVKWLEGIGEPDEWSNDNEVVVEAPPTVVSRHGVNKVTMDWTGEGSRDAMVDGGLAKFLSFTKGAAEFVFIAEDGSLFGLRVSDGAMFWYKVGLCLLLGEPCDPPKDRWARGEE
jgi:hypothetical protein